MAPTAYLPWSTNISSSTERVFVRVSTVLETAFAKSHSVHHHLRRSDEAASQDRTVTALVIVMLSIEVLIVLMLISMVISVAFGWVSKRQRVHLNPEQQRAEEVLNSHPRPLDIELGMVQNRSTLNWPLTNNTPIPAPRRTRDPYDSQVQLVGSETPANYRTRDDFIETDSRRISNLDIAVGGMGTSVADIPQIWVTNTEDMQAFNPESNERAPNVITSFSISQQFHRSWN
ncbi:hypothetical protein F4802DRAFT_618916 [Xylaria palmicola]|nr:hypothetical protein F4802DRAFT_618916 [Xylaria palmicola]